MLCVILIVVSISVGIHLGNNKDDELQKEKVRPNKIIFAQKLINVPAISQYPELPTGCVSVAATMVLQYHGVDITPGEFVISWLEYNENFYWVDGNLHGPDPNKVFAGNPFTNN